MMAVNADTHRHHIEERAVFAGGGVRAVGTNGIAGGFWRRGRVSLECVAWLVE